MALSCDSDSHPRVFAGYSFALFNFTRHGIHLTRFGGRDARCRSCMRGECRIGEDLSERIGEYFRFRAAETIFRGNSNGQPDGLAELSLCYIGPRGTPVGAKAKGGQSTKASTG
jgi:hypothetical protein